MGHGLSPGNANVIESSRSAHQTGRMQQTWKTAAALLLASTLSSAAAGQCRDIHPFMPTAQTAPLIVQVTVTRHAQTLVPQALLRSGCSSS